MGLSKPQKKMLLEISGGVDPNVWCQIVQVGGGRRMHEFARTMLSLHRLGMLQFASKGGLEISAKGRAAAEKLKAVR